MKGVILGINPEATIVDICHSIEPQNILQGAFVLSTAFCYFPQDTVHLVVVDPGVGGPRRPIILETDSAIFVAPDNGILSYVFQTSASKCVSRRSLMKLPPELQAFEITNSKYWRHPVSSTFQGRDVFAPVAAHVSRGIPLDELGRPPASKRQRPGSGRTTFLRAWKSSSVFPAPRWLPCGPSNRTSAGSSGPTPWLPSMATVAWEGRRRDYFEKQLMEILKLIDARHVKADEMTGSWAGAMGQLQFMPETLRAYWHDWNGNGHVDVWNDPAEALASAANYLSKIGWKAGEPWGMPVTLPDTMESSRADTSMTMAQWKSAGVLSLEGRDLTASERKATLIIVEKNAFLVHSNYDRLRNWNRSHFFALAVCQLADRTALSP